MTAALEEGEWSAARPGHTLPPRKTRYPLYRRLGEAQGRSGRAENLVPTGIFFKYIFIDPSVPNYNGCAEDISVIYCQRTVVTGQQIRQFTIE